MPRAKALKATEMLFLTMAAAMGGFDICRNRSLMSSLVTSPGSLRSRPLGTNRYAFDGTSLVAA